MQNCVHAMKVRRRCWGDSVTVCGTKYSDSLQADELLLFKQSSPSTRRGRPHQLVTLGNCFHHPTPQCGHL